MRITLEIPDEFRLVSESDRVGVPVSGGGWSQFTYPAKVVDYGEQRRTEPKTKEELLEMLARMRQLSAAPILSDLLREIIERLP